MDAETLDALDRLALAGISTGIAIAQGKPVQGSLSVPAGPRPVVTTVNSGLIVAALALGLYFLLK